MLMAKSENFRPSPADKKFTLETPGSGPAKSGQPETKSKSGCFRSGREITGPVGSYTSAEGKKV
jgi:hypothetical protein